MIRLVHHNNVILCSTCNIESNTRGSSNADIFSFCVVFMGYSMRLNSERHKNSFYLFWNGDNSTSWSTLKWNIDTASKFCFLDFCTYTTGGASYPEKYPAVAILLEFSPYVNMNAKKKKIAFPSKSLINLAPIIIQLAV